MENEEKVLWAAFEGGYVLRNVKEKFVGPLYHGYYTVKIFAKGLRGQMAELRVPAENVWKYQEDKDQPNQVTIDVVLSEEQYQLYYKRLSDGKPMVKPVCRETIWEWYYEKNFMLYPFYYDMMCVPKSGLGPYEQGQTWRTVMWQSSILLPGTPLMISVDRKDIVYVPKLEQVTEHTYMETGFLRDFVHVRLSDAVYKVVYKTSETGWKLQSEQVEKEMLIRDYIHMKRAQMHHMNPLDWMEYRNLRISDKLE